MNIFKNYKILSSIFDKHLKIEFQFNCTNYELHSFTESLLKIILPS